MTPIFSAPAATWKNKRFVLLDIDDTLTTDGRLAADSYRALEALHQRGFIVIPVTGRPAGWCDMIARFWPVHAVVGENGAFYFSYDHDRRKMHRRHALSQAERSANRKRLDALAAAILPQSRALRLPVIRPIERSTWRSIFARMLPRCRPVRSIGSLRFSRPLARSPRSARSMSMAGSAVMTS